MNSQLLATIWQILIVMLYARLSSGQVPFEPYPERERRLVQSVSFSSDGSKMYLSHLTREIMKQGGDSSSTYPELSIYEAKWENGKWSASTLMPFSGNELDYEPTISPDGNYIFFNSKRPFPDERPVDKNNIWFVRKTPTGWSTPELAAFCTFENDESYATLTTTNRLYFLAGIPAPHLTEGTNYEIYWADYDGVNFTSPQPVTAISSENGEGDPWVSPDESYLIFTRFVNGDWRKTCDLYVTFRVDGNWMEPLNLVELNTPESPDFAVAISPDQRWIYYRTNFKFVKREFQPILIKYKEQALRLYNSTQKR